MDSIYHGCFRKNVDGTNRIIGRHEKRLVPSSKPFWKYIEDIPAGVKTRSQYNKQCLALVREFDTSFRNKNKETIERLETAPDSEVRILRPSDPIYVF